MYYLKKSYTTKRMMLQSHMKIALSLVVMVIFTRVILPKGGTFACNGMVGPHPGKH